MATLPHGYASTLFHGMAVYTPQAVNSPPLRSDLCHARGESKEVDRLNTLFVEAVLELKSQVRDRAATIPGLDTVLSRNPSSSDCFRRLVLASTARAHLTRHHLLSTTSSRCYSRRSLQHVVRGM